MRLWSVTPTTIKAKTAAIESIKHELDQLEAGTGSRDRLPDAEIRKAVEDAAWGTRGLDTEGCHLERSAVRRTRQPPQDRVT